jgi:hypothetical protein
MAVEATAVGAEMACWLVLRDSQGRLCRAEKHRRGWAV